MSNLKGLMETLNPLKLVATIILVVVCFGASASDYSIPKGYTLLEAKNGIDLFEKDNDNVFIQVVDLQGGAYLSHMYGRKKGEDFYRYPINRLLPNNSKSYSVVNGAFFNNEVNPTDVSFPFTPLNDKWRNSGKTRTLCTRNKYAFVINNDYSQPKFTHQCTFSITLLNPSVNKSSGYSIGRTYIGVPSPNSTTNGMSRYVFFFIAQNKTQFAMEQIAKKWSVNKGDLAMGDGSASAQFYSKKYSLYGSKCPSYAFSSCLKRSIPHAIVTKHYG